tara:strand:- start:50 stop:547 length:498 start_codon:yes stop_codon:yes gene_type:complete
MLKENFEKIFKSINEIFNIIISDKSTLILVIVLIVLFISISIFIFYKYYKDLFDKNHVLNKEFINKKDNSNDVVIMFFYTDWCPYCKSSLPEWNKFEEYIKNLRNSIDYNITLTKINGDKDEKTVEKYNIEGYPTIKLLYKGKVYDYDARPNKDNLVKFFETSIQ